MSAYFLFGILRNLWRSKLNSLINIASLALGLAVFAFAFLYVKKELSYDRSWPDAQNIYRLVVDQRGVPGSPDGSFTSVNTRAYAALVENYQGHIERIAKAYTATVKPAGTPSSNYVNMAVADPVFIELFQFDVISGSLDDVFAVPGFVAVEESYANSFPDRLTIGSTIELESNFIGTGGVRTSISYQVAAIFRARETLSPNLDYRLLTLMHDYSLGLYSQGMRMWQDSHQIWLRFRPGVDITEFEALMPAFIDRVVTAFNTTLPPGERISEHLFYRFQPLTDMHLNPVGNELGRGDRNRVLTVAVLGLLVLLVGCSNSISLSLATVLERRREIGIRKSAGALPGNILVQYLGEAVLLAVLALLPALALVNLLLPPFVTLLRVTGGLELAAADYAALVAIAVVVCLLSGAYPAFVLSRVKPQLVLKAGAVGQGRGTQRTRTLLVGFQFCFALTLMIATLALYAQLQTAREQPLGFNPDNLLFVAVTSDTERSAQGGLLDELRKIPGITLAGSVGMPPNAYAQGSAGSAFPFVNKSGELTEARLTQSLASPEQFELLGVPLLAGRTFDAARDRFDPATRQFSDGAPSTESRIIVNRTATRALGFAQPEDAVDQAISRMISMPDGRVQEAPMRIIGVVEDNLYTSVRSRPVPEAYMHLASGGAAYLLKFDDGVADKIIDEVTQVWQRVTGAPLRYVTFVEPLIDSAFITEQNESRLLLYGAGLALFLSCIGLYGLAAFTLARNIKEIGVRKVLGSSVGSIARLYLWRYARPVLIASVIAVPVAIYFILQWMQRFPYQMDKAWLAPLALAAVSVVLMIALLTVSGVIVKAARARPVLALRYE